MNRHLAFERLHNFRDLGGYRTRNGRTTRWSTLYRSDSLAKLRGADLERFRDLGVRTVVDLRHPWEIEGTGRVPDTEGLDFRNLSVEHRAWDQGRLGEVSDPWRYLADRYAEVAVDGTRELAEVLTVLAHGEGPLVFHCASGKDRTGIVAALVLTLVGVDEDAVAADFALTELATERLRADWSDRNGGRAPTWEHYGRAPEDVIRHFLADLRTEHGSVEKYVSGALGVPESTVEALRTRLL
ncbi:tyrosine-protein phosphatase [Streptomyces sp. NPDC049954]|uniref:tyrosine-protein phosphatase n=1 Tax=Streptomyces sp. NPDC049954 TaxID=3155779 RepID=UPI0034450F44